MTRTPAPGSASQSFDQAVEQVLGLVTEPPRHPPVHRRHLTLVPRPADHEPNRTGPGERSS